MSLFAYFSFRKLLIGFYDALPLKGVEGSAIASRDERRKR